MIILNFSHPLTEKQRHQAEQLLNKEITELRKIPAQFDNQSPFHHQVRQLVQEINLTPDEWQTESIAINPPSYNFAAVTLLAELHGRMGYFPPMLRLRTVPNSLPPEYEVAEILNLQAIRDSARKER